MDAGSISTDNLRSIADLPQRSRSPEKSRKGRRGQAIEFGDRAGSSEGLLREGYANSRTVPVGRYSEERTKKRDSKHYAAPNEEEVAAIISNLDRAGSASGKHRLAPLSSSSSRLISPMSTSEPLNRSLGSTHSHSLQRPHAVAAQPPMKRAMKNNFVTDSTSAGAVLTSQILQVPNARLGFEVPIANDNSMFGTTQVEGCRGDFCDLDTDAVENPELKNNGTFTLSTSKDNKSMNEFRKRLSQLDQNEELKKQTSLMTAMIKGETRGLRGSASANDLETSAKQAAKLANRLKPNKFMPLNLIIQCRMEMPFVKLQLRRHKNNEVGDYVTEDNYQDLAAGMSLPAHYYNDVPVCDVCYNMYKIVHTARQKAINKINKKRDDEKIKSLTRSASAQDYYTAKQKVASVKTSNVSAPGVERQYQHASGGGDSGIEYALQAVAGLTKHDVAEIRTLSRPHPAVIVVMEALMTLLTGHPVPFDELKKLLATGDVFLNMLKDFRLEQVTDEILRRMEGYVDNNMFRPENVKPVSLCASKFCAWVLGVVQAARWERGQGHKRTNFMGQQQQQQQQAAPDTNNQGGGKSTRNSSKQGDELTFVQKLENKRRSKRTSEGDEEGSPQFARNTRSVSPPSRSTAAPKGNSLKHLSQRELATFKAAQNKSVNRLASLVDSGKKLVGEMVYFRCRDGITKMPYVVVGSIPLEVKRCNFIVIHDFFDTCDGTSILFKPLVQRHPGSQVVCFNYPGQANTVWPRPPQAEKDRGAKEPVLNNDWIADRLNELLQHIEQDGGIMLSSPFHLVGIGNGACIAAAFLQRWGRDPHYAKGLRSLVSINGFLAPDPQLTAVLHQAAQLFETTPHNRPDIPVSYWSRFMFSNQYLQKIHPNLALNIYTAVSNPITNDGRYKIASGCLNHRDLRNGLNPDVDLNPVSDSINFQLSNARVPVLMLQSTENALVNASNVDPFLKGRTLKHLWSHQQNYLSEAVLAKVKDVTSQWVGGMASGPDDYSQFSMLGRDGVRMLMESLQSPRSCFVMWTTAGHLVQQENKRAILDFLDVLACPTEEHTGCSVPTNMPFGGKGISLSTSLRQEGITMPDKESSVLDLSNSFVITKPEFDKEKEKKQKQAMDDEEAWKNRYIEKEVEVESVAARVAREAEEARKAAMHVKEEPEPSMISEFTVDTAPTRPAEPLASPENSDFTIEGATTLPNAEVIAAADASASATAEESAVPPTDASEEVPNADVVAAADASASATAEPNDAEAESVPPVEATVSASPKASADADAVSPVVSTREESPVAAGRSVASSITGNNSVSFAEPAVSPPVQQAPAATSNMANEASMTQNVTMSTNTNSMTPKSQPPPQIPEKITVEKAATKVASVTKSQKAPDEPKSSKNMTLTSADEGLIANREERTAKTWTEKVPEASEVLALEGEIAQKQKDFLELQEKIEKEKLEQEVLRLQRLKNDQLTRAKQYEAEDKLLLEKLEKELAERRRQRALAEKQRLLEIQNIDKKLVESGIVDAHQGTQLDAESAAMNDSILSAAASLLQADREPVQEMNPLPYSDPIELPVAITENIASNDVLSSLDKMVADEAEQKKKGIMSVEEFEKVKRQMAQRQIERDQKLRHLAGDEQHILFENSAMLIQRIGRGYNGKKRAALFRERREMQRKVDLGLTMAQAYVRGMMGRRRARVIKQRYLQTLKYGEATLTAQRVMRGHLARKRFRILVRFTKARHIQRCLRGRFGRKAAKRERDRLDLLRRKQLGACKIQSAWRMKVAKEEFRSLRIHMLAAIEIQRTYRGYLGRKKLQRRRKWESTAPGPDRIKLGLELIEESKVAFERQQEEIDALHRAQERAESRVSHITNDLKDSERELMVLERELQEIDQIERDLITLTHERELLSKNVKDAAGMPRIAGKNNSEVVMGKEPSNFANDPDVERRRKAEAYALEMTIQMKRAEREKKRQELETEFAAVFQDVEKKKKALQRLEASLADMESTRERKDREFRRLQKNLMQLLLEQKQELDELREKGIELETATATTAAAATATAQKAKEHEKQSKAMFGQTEELMKFQFMSMSLSYFSSLNMLKQLRDMNADTTSAAVASSADAAAAAAASAAAANLPSMKKLELGANDVVELSIQKKKAELEAAEHAENEAKKAKANPLPENVKLWTVSDVIRWLETLSLSQYAERFREATVDGPFLMELREEDLVDVLSIKHKLHVRKILVSREKLKPLSEQERAKKEIVEREERADAERAAMGVPSLDTVFSQCRNGRIKRVEESLNLGFPIDSVDERGNTLLLISCQNSNKRLVEMLLLRGANVNHQNMTGNTALHFALAFDAEGLLGEYLIEHGADDSIENADGLTPYDGVGKM